MTLVMKFGGSSVADAACLRQVADLVVEALPEAPVVVLSAMGGTTDALFAAARAAERGDLDGALEGLEGVRAHHDRAVRALFEDGPPAELADLLAGETGELEVLLRGVSMLRELTLRSLDAIVSCGERLSTAVLAAHLGRLGVDRTRVDARSVVRTDDRFGSARPRPAEIRELAAAHLAPHVRPGRAVVTQGYVGSTDDGLTTTLGRGGSDYSAALLGAALGAREVQVWTDVEGVLTSDPRVVAEAEPIPELGFAEAAELAAFGARVLHPATIQPAVEAEIPVTVRSTQRPHGAFTTITASGTTRRAVTALASRGPVTVMTVRSLRMLAHSGFLARLFEVFGRHGVSVDVVATAEVSVSLTVEADAPLQTLVEELSEFASVEVASERTLVAVVGERLKHTPGIGSRVFAALSEINVEMISMGANEINLSVVVRSEDADEALRRLHRELIQSP